AGTITTMIRGLHAKGLVDYKVRSGVKLTPKGRRAALHVLRRHRLIESFLVEIMHMDWSEVHEDAEALEHVVSDRFLARMDEMLGFPSTDPHGDPIPASGSELPANDAPLLSEAEPGVYEVSRVDDQAADFLDWLSGAKLKPGQPFTLQKIDPVAGVFTLKVPGTRALLPVSQTIAAKIRIIPAEV
ncbi:MAG: metal-dependent transcriptional regulator, partial [Kiritimatiellia bacterium]